MERSELPTPAKGISTSSKKRFGRYDILAPLAEGGMAQVHLAVRDGAESTCVLKRLRVEMSDKEVTSKRFEREANLVAQLSHPNIAQVIDAGREGAVFYIAMEYIAGKDVEALMHHLMDRGRMLPYVASVHIALQTLKALAYAHQATDPAGEALDLVHRDLSPRNIMIGYDGAVKVIDFGLARGKIDDFKTAPGMLMGTLRYISPEQALAIPADARSDLYTLSVLLWEMLCGRFLVEGQETTQILQQVVHEVPPLVSEINPNLPREFDLVLAKGLAKEVDDRFSSAQAYYDALKQAAGELNKLDPKNLGLFTRQLFPEDFEDTQEHLQNPRPISHESHEITRAQEVSLATQTAFVIPERPKASTPSESRKVTPDSSVPTPSSRPAPPLNAQQVITWVLCLIIVGSAAFIGTRFLEQVIKKPVAPSAAPPQTAMPSVQAISAKAKLPSSGPKPQLKAPNPPATSKKVVTAKKQIKVVQPSTPSAMALLRKKVQELQDDQFDETRWANVLNRIQQQADSLSTQSDTKRILRLAKKGMAYKRSQYFMRALDELEKLK